MISISKAWDATRDFHFRHLQINPWRSSNFKCVYDRKVTRKGQSRSKVKMHFCELGNMVNISVYRHHGPITTDRTIRPIFTFVTLTIEMISLRSSKVKFFCGFWKSGIDFPLVFHSNPMLISHHQEDIGDCHIRDQMTPEGHSRSKLMIHFYLVFNGEHFWAV